MVFKPQFSLPHPPELWQLRGVEPAPPIDILLCALNAKYPHTAFGIRYLFANLDDLAPRARLLEFTIHQSAREIAEQILAYRPRVVGLGVYIWNTREVLPLVEILKAVAPEVKIVLGGPEVSFEYENQPLFARADHLVCGEGDVLFRELCEKLLNGAPVPKVIQGDLPDLKTLQLPYALYSDTDIQNRVIYVEASRGCPYKCEYCLSSLDKSVRAFPLDAFLAEMQTLIERGARQFKFVDRTFNLSITTSRRILEFFLARMDLGLFLHFEMVPDRLPTELRELIEQFPAGSLQFEVGIQTWNPQVAHRVSRRQDYAKIRENLTYLREKTGVHVHADLIAGLPGETWESFAAGFDAVWELAPEEIQLGILKRLRGTPISRHTEEWEMRYEPHAPYTILSNRVLSYEQVQELIRIAKHWDLVANRGHFPRGMELLAGLRTRPEFGGSFFAVLRSLSAFLAQRHPFLHSIALISLMESVWTYLTQAGLPAEAIRTALAHDYAGRGVSRDLPAYLRDAATMPTPRKRPPPAPSIPTRQARHQVAESSEPAHP